MFTLPNYLPINKLYESPHSIIYRAQNIKTTLPVILKILQPAYPLPEKAARFKREYEITRSLSKTIPDVIAPYSLQIHEHQWVIVMEDFGGESLAKLNMAGRLTLNEFLTLAIQIAGVLIRIHQHGVIHKDINPANIILNSQTEQLKFIDFGASTQLTRETPIFRIPDLLEGTPAYLAPEQTGRMNRSLDYRADFYSLGATFYELLTGKTPFPTTDILELIHCHIARAPQSPHVLRPDIPPAVNALVLKLLAKNAEDRYQSAHGLKTDLEACLRQYQASGRIDSITLGEYDYSDQIQLPQKLYGRENEITALLTSMEQVGANVHTLNLITGHSGVGKSALVQEVFKSLQPGYFLTGKFDQFKRGIPYFAILQAFRGLMQQLLAESEEKITLWRERLLNAFGSNGKIMIDMLPEVGLIIGTQPPVPDLSPIEAQNRVHLLILNFLRVFAMIEYPLALFLDDLQWADGASLDLLEYLLLETDIQGFLVFGAYSDNEVSAGHPLMMTLSKIEKAGMQVDTLNLQPLGQVEATHYLADALACKPDQVEPLAELLLAKTDGNPFFLGEFLKALHADALLTFSPPSEQKAGGWQWDLGQIQSRNLTNNVVELLANNVKQLPLQTQQILKLAACLGNHFELETLALVAQKATHETALDLWPALNKGMLQPLSAAYQLAELDVEGFAESVTVEYKFVPDRLQQAVYSRMPETERQAEHLHIGRWLFEKIPADEREARIFDIVNHLNLGSALIQDESERDHLAELNWQAGKRAKLSAANAPAYSYLNSGLQLLNSQPISEEEIDMNAAQSWERRPALTLALCEDAAESAYLSGQMDRMENLIECVLNHTHTILEKTRIYEIKSQALASEGRFAEVVQTNLPVLAALGMHLPAKPGFLHIALALVQSNFTLAAGHPEVLIGTPNMTDPRALAVMRLLIHLGPATYLSNPNLFLLQTLKTVITSVRFGNTHSSPAAYSAYGLVLCGAIGKIDSGYRLGKVAVQLAERPDSRPYYARTAFTFEYGIRHWKEPLRATLLPLLTAYQTALETGDLQYAAYCLNNYSWNIWLAGQDLPQVEQTLRTYSEICRQIKQNYPRMNIQIYQQAALNLMEQTIDPRKLSGYICDEDEVLPRLLQAKAFLWVYNLYILKAFLCYLFGDYSAALENIGLAEKYKDSVIGSYTSVLLPFYRSLTQLAVALERPEPERWRMLKQVKSSQKQLKKWADHAPANHKHKWHLVEAELARVQGRFASAREHYDQAIALAHQNDFLHEEALACELAGRFYTARNQTRQARYYLRDAHSIYRSWGATAKARDLETHYPHLVDLTGKASTEEDVSRTTDRYVATTFDLASILQAGQVLSVEITFDKLLTKLMQVVIANAGAQTGYLLLEQAGQWVIEAKGTVGSPEISILQALPAHPDLLPMTLLNFVVRTRESLVLTNAGEDNTFRNDPYVQTRKPLSVLCMPLIYQGRVTALLYLENNLTSHAFTPARLETLRLLSAEAAIALENARLYAALEKNSRTLEEKVAERTRDLLAANTELERLANHDSLTGALARRRFFELANLEHERSRRYGRLFSILIIDLDHFKKINDTFGHAAGDVVLRTAVEYMSNILRSNDLLGRYGGEEFLILLPETTHAGAQIIAERIRQAVASKSVDYENTSISITGSVGLASLQEGESIAQIVNRADAALYAAKQTGRNRVVSLEAN